MKSAALLLFLIISAVIPGVLWSQTLESVVDFDLELSSLADPGVSEAARRGGRIVILEGLMGDTLVDTDSAEGGVWVNLVGGSWIGTDAVRAYSCRILFRGEAWKDVFPGIGGGGGRGGLYCSGKPPSGCRPGDRLGSRRKSAHGGDGGFSRTQLMPRAGRAWKHDILGANELSGGFQ